ncbi:unnamed protein product [Oreochromis niloticus]|nr:unnamed protein product [Mustela putorius furo]
MFTLFSPSLAGFTWTTSDYPRDSYRDHSRSSGAVVSASIVLGAVGFTTAGIAAGSCAASWMSAAADGGGAAAGSLVVVLQSAGMAGLFGTATAAVELLLTEERKLSFAIKISRFQSRRRADKDMDPVAAVCTAAGAVGAVVAAPALLGAAGFTSAGIAAGSYAAGMSSAAAANGGGVAAGGCFAVSRCSWSVSYCWCSCGWCWSSNGMVGEFHQLKIMKNSYLLYAKTGSLVILSSLFSSLCCVFMMLIFIHLY